MRPSLANLALTGCGLFASAPNPACPSDRTIVLDRQDDVDAFAVCTTASSVKMRTGATIDVASLDKLEVIKGDLAIGPTVGVEEIDLTELREVGGTVRVSANGSLKKLFLPRLEKVGRFEVDGNGALTTVSLPRLAVVEGAMTITDNPWLQLVDASSLVSVGKSLVIAGQPRLTLVLMPVLANAETVTLVDLPQVAPDKLDALRTKATVELR